MLSELDSCILLEMPEEDIDMIGAQYSTAEEAEVAGEA